MTFALALSGAVSGGILRPPTPAGEALEAGHPHIGEADTDDEQRGQVEHVQSLERHGACGMCPLGLTCPGVLSTQNVGPHM